MAPEHSAPDAPRPLRLFAAVDLDEAVRDQTARAIAKARIEAPEARWLAPDAVHLTLFFFGTVEAARLPELESALSSTAVRSPRFRLRVQGSGTFGNPRQPRVLWLGLEGDLEALARLQAEVAAAAEGLGFPVEARRFSPHLTLARTKAPRGDPRLASAAAFLSEVACGETVVSKLVLYRSQLSDRGARHLALREFRLGPAT